MLALAVQYGLFRLLLHEQLRTRELSRMRPALTRWLKVVFAWQVLVIAASAIYIVVMGSTHPRGIAWGAPPVGAVVGTALPLQVAAMAILRASRGA